MNDTPNDIKRAALVVFWKLANRAEATKQSGEPFWSDENTAGIIAEALEAERELCAKRAGEYDSLAAQAVIAGEIE